jgi:NitT/TauT family transport system substrate-binding protein
VVAANVLEPNVMVGSEEFRSYWTEHGAAAFEQFRADKGRKPRFATLPAGSTPDVFLRFWITESLGLDLDVVEIVGQSPGALQSTLSTGNADGGSAIEPIPTILQENPETEMEPFLYAGEIMPGQPGAVLQPSQRLIDDRPEFVRELVEIHVRATEFIHENRERAAGMASEVIGSDILTAAVANRAINSPAANYVSNPHRIVDKSLVYNDFHQGLGSVDTDLSEADVFDHSFYDGVSDGG